MAEQGTKATLPLDTRHAPRLKHVIACIDGEVHRIADELLRPGWTRWALLVALGTVIWLVVETWGRTNSRHLTSTQLQLFLSFSLTLDLASWLHFQLSTRPIREMRGRFRSANHFLPTGRAHIALDTVRSGVLLYLSLELFRGTVIGWLPSLNYGISLSIGLLTFLVSWIDFPIADDSHPQGSKSAGRIFSVAVAVIGSVATVQQLQLSWISWRDGLSSISDVQLAGLFACTFLILEKIVAEDHGQFTINTLRRIRQDLLLGRISCGTAANQADIALQGLRLSDVLEEHVSRLIDLMTDLCTDVQRDIDCLKALQQISAPNAMPEAKKEIIRATLTKLQERKSQQDIRSRKAAWLNRRNAIMFETLAPTAELESETKIFIQRMNDAVAALDGPLEERDLLEKNLIEVCGFVAISSKPDRRRRLLTWVRRGELSRTSLRN